MTTHELVWKIIDTLAAKQNLSVSGLAKKCDLDPTTFNVSKRGSADKPRYPAFPTIMKVLQVCGMAWDDWADIWNELQPQEA